MTNGVKYFIKVWYRTWKLIKLNFIDCRAQFIPDTLIIALHVSDNLKLTVCKLDKHNVK